MIIKTIKQFDTLYTLDSRGKLRIFDCKIEPTLDDELGYVIRTSTGIKGGKQVEQTTIIRTGKNIAKKNETTPLEQALLEADSLWRAKFDEGYKSINMLSNKLSDIGAGVTIAHEPERTEAILNKANKYLTNWHCTNSNWDELPMLAKKYKDVKKPDYPFVAQPKLNGVRCMVKKEGEYIKMISRGGGYYYLTQIHEQMQMVYEKLEHLGLKGNYIFDGELYKHGIPLQDISGACRKEDVGIFVTNNWVEYHIYDIINLDRLDEIQGDRAQLLLTIQGFCERSHIKFVPTLMVYSEEDVKLLHDNFVKDGYEGLMLRSPDRTYEFNQRSSALLKMKSFQDEEFEIKGCEVDENKSIEESFVFVLYNNQGKMLPKEYQQLFKARPTGSETMKREWYNNIDKYIGKYATVRFFDRSKEGIPTMGVLQHKDTKCLVENIRPDKE